MASVSAYQRSCRSRHRHPHRARPDRRRRARRLLCARRRGARRHRRRAEPGRDDCQRDHPDHRRALAQAPQPRRATFCSRARRSGWNSPGRRSRHRGRPGRAAGQSQRQLWRTDRRARRIRLELADDVAVKAVGDYSIVGQSVPRVDLPAKATGELIFCARRPRARHAARPRGAAALCRRRCRRLRRHQPDRGRRGLGARYSRARRRRRASAISSASSPSARRMRSRRPRSSRCSWKPTPALPDLDDVETALRANPSTPRTLIDKGDVDAAIAGAAKPMQRTYVWPYQMHASIGPSCAVADFRGRPCPGLVGHAEPARRCAPISRC